MKKKKNKKNYFIFKGKMKFSTRAVNEIRDEFIGFEFYEEYEGEIYIKYDGLFFSIKFNRNPLQTEWEENDLELFFRPALYLLMQKDTLVEGKILFPLEKGLLNENQKLSLKKIEEFSTCLDFCKYKWGERFFSFKEWENELINYYRKRIRGKK